MSTRAAAEPSRFGVGGGAFLTVVSPAIGPELELGIARTSWWAGFFVRGALSGNPIDSRGSFTAYGSLGGGFRSFWGDWGNGAAPVLGVGLAASAMHVFEGRTEEDTGCVGRCTTSNTSGFGPYVELGILFRKEEALRIQLTMRLDIPLTAWEGPAIPLTVGIRVSP